jgi:homoserine dehydrogenase
VTFDLVLMGFGNVGRRFVRLLDEVGLELSRDHDLHTRVVGIATRSRGCVFDAKSLNAPVLAAQIENGGRLGRRVSPLTFLRETLRRCSTAARRRRLVVVEVTTLDIVQGQPAIDHIRISLAGGAHVISSNKGPAAFAHHALEIAARRADRCFLFESAVLDGVPLFNMRRAALGGVAISGFRGVVNSTTNYVLTAMERGETFDGALAAMQRSGTAEADASLDIEGWDAAAKTAVLANVLLGARLTPQTVDREGLTAAAAQRILAAQAVDRRVKLVASAEKAAGIVRGRVQLVDLPDTDLLAGLDGQENALILHTDLLGELAIVQRGSGLTPTAYGLVADLVSIQREVQRTHASRRPPRPARCDRTPRARDRR